MTDFEAIRKFTVDQRHELEKQPGYFSHVDTAPVTPMETALAHLRDLLDEVERLNGEIQKMLSGATVIVNMPPVSENVYTQAIRELQIEVGRLRHKAGECACDSRASQYGWDDVQCVWKVRDNAAKIAKLKDVGDEHLRRLHGSVNTFTVDERRGIIEIGEPAPPYDAEIGEVKE